MGKAAGTVMKKKKKKGRPSLLDVQKRLIKQQKLQHSPAEIPNSHSDTHSNPSQRSIHRNPNSDWSHLASELISGEGDDDDERIEKKRRPLVGLDSQSPNLLADDNYEGEKVSKVTDTGNVHGSLEVSGPTTPLPDKKLLAFILDRLQKKDTHGVFSEPVDPEELPDYHHIIKHPMDFGTVRKKLDGGAYANLEQFEKDIFLICSNAMQYNPSDTVFFRQARSMQEIAKNDFESLRQESDDSELEQPKETPKVARKGRPPGSGKGSKKFPEAYKSAADRIRTEASSDTVLADGNNSFLSSTYNLRRASDPCVFQPADSTANAFRGTLNRENQNSWLADFDKEFPASVLRRVMKEGKKLFTTKDNRRETYNPNWFRREQSVLHPPEEVAAKQLALVDIRSEHAYARSVAQFAADLGPVARRIASKKIASALPHGMDFSPGRMIGENGTLESHQFQTRNENPCKASITHQHYVGSLQPEEDDAHLVRRLASQSKLTSPSTSLSDVKHEPFLQKFPGVVVSNGYTLTHPTSVNSIDSAVQKFSRGFQPLTTLEATPEEQKPHPCDPDGRFMVSGSSDSSSSQQPDLGLQL